MRTQGLYRLLESRLADELLRTLRRRRRGLRGASNELLPAACVATPRWREACPPVDEGHRAQVLVIDRDREVLELLACILSRADITFQAVHDAACAVHMLSTWQPRVVILDSYDLDLLEQLLAHER